MGFRRYAKGAIVAVDDRGNVVLLRFPGGPGGLLRTRDGMPRTVIERADIADVAAIFECIAKDLDRNECTKRGVEVEE